MNNTAKRVGSASKKFAKMKINMLLVVIALVLSDLPAHTCWEVCASHRGVCVCVCDWHLNMGLATLLSLCVLQALASLVLLHGPYPEGTNVASFHGGSVAAWSINTNSTKLQDPCLDPCHTCDWHTPLSRCVLAGRSKQERLPPEAYWGIFILAHFLEALPTRLAVLLIPRMTDPYMLYLVVKVTNHRWKWYKTLYQSVLLKGRYNRPKLSFLSLCGQFMLV